MSAVRLAYSPLVNAGDRLNVDIVEKLSGRKVVRSKVYNADMTAIGGALFGAQYSDGFRGFMQRCLSVIYGNKPLYVFGSGFLYSDNPNPLYRTNLVVCALRGEKTRAKLSSITGESYDNAVLADAGLLVEMIMDAPAEKKYNIGLIPHFSQQEEFMSAAGPENTDLHFIDIRKSPKEVAEEISSCMYVASSSLHGLIFADALHVPSLRLIGSSPLPGGEFKFEDYYSSYGIRDNPWRTPGKLPGVKDIEERCCIDYDLVDKKKRELVDCFPKF